MAQEAALVATRFAEARETGILDLTSCKLTQIPSTIYIYIKEKPVTKCTLANNELRQIPPKFFQNCTAATEMNLANNCLQMLPDEILQLKSLETLNLSSNSFSRFPRCLFFIDSLKRLNFQDNCIEEFDLELLDSMKRLERLNLEGNPLTDDMKEMLETMENQITITH